MIELRIGILEGILRVVLWNIFCHDSQGENNFLKKTIFQKITFIFAKIAGLGIAKEIQIIEQGKILLTSCSQFQNRNIVC